MIGAALSAASKALDLTLGDLLAIAGVVIAVVGALLAPLAISMRRRHAETAAALAALKAAAAVPTLALRSQAIALLSVSVAFEASIGLMHRMVTGRSNEIDGNKAIDHLHEVKIGVERAAAEAALLVDDEARQVAALQQLVHRIGDQSTLRLLDEATDVERIGALTGKDFRRAADELRERLARPHG